MICTNTQQIKNNFREVINTPKQIDAFAQNPAVLYSEHHYGPLLIQCERPGEVMCRILDSAEIVNAAGGLVKNEHDELLMIHRRGFWDLPKGKLELRETAAEGAKREVEEETGIQIESVTEPSVVTYHAYTLKKNRYIKHTDWYLMRAKSGQQNLVPQTEEDIDEVRWVKKNDLPDILPLSYPLIADLVRQHF